MRLISLTYLLIALAAGVISAGLLISVFAEREMTPTSRRGFSRFTFCATMIALGTALVALAYNVID